jgi:hypothetical protein
MATTASDVVSSHHCFSNNTDLDRRNSSSATTKNDDNDDNNDDNSNVVTNHYWNRRLIMTLDIKSLLEEMLHDSRVVLYQEETKGGNKTIAINCTQTLVLRMIRIVHRLRHSTERYHHHHRHHHHGNHTKDFNDRLRIIHHYLWKRKKLPEKTRLWLRLLRCRGQPHQNLTFTINRLPTPSSSSSSSSVLSPSLLSLKEEPTITASSSSSCFWEPMKILLGPLYVSKIRQCCWHVYECRRKFAEDAAACSNKYGCSSSTNNNSIVPSPMLYLPGGSIIPQPVRDLYFSTPLPKSIEQCRYQPQLVHEIPWHDHYGQTCAHLTAYHNYLEQQQQEQWFLIH